MMDRIRHAASVLDNDFIRDWKAGNGHVVGYSCTFIPEEIIHAAGLLPYRLRGIGTSSVSIGDSYFGPVNCSLPKCMLQLAGQGSYGFLDGAVISNGCDSMRRLEECWRKASDDYPGTLPGYYEYFSVPHKATDYSIDFYTQELRYMIGTLERHFRVKITDEGLRKSIGNYNRRRALLQKIDELRHRPEVPVTGEDAMSVLIGAHAMPLEEWTARIEVLIEEWGTAPSVSAGKKRLMLVGSANDDVDFIRLIEGSDAIVVADTVCFGSRTYANPVDEKSEPVKALASHYLSTSICPRMLGLYKERRTYIMETVKKASVEGVILQNVRFCDLHGSENGVLERDLEAAGIPCMRLEREYGPLVETGRIKMRLDAFMERIS